MQIQTVPPINFIYFEVEATSCGSPDYFLMIRLLYLEASIMELSVAGALQWHYRSVKGETPSHVQIALPILGFPADYDGQFHLKRTDPFFCLAETYIGGKIGVSHAFEKMYGYANKRALPVSGYVREICAVTGTANEDAYILQLGLAATR